MLTWSMMKNIFFGGMLQFVNVFSVVLNLRLPCGVGSAASKVLYKFPTLTADREIDYQLRTFFQSS